MNTQTNAIVTNLLTGEQFTAAVPSLGWEDAAKEQGAALWGVDWDSMACKRPNTKQDTDYPQNEVIATFGIFEVRNFGTHYAVYGCGQNIMSTGNLNEAMNRARMYHTLRPSWAD